ncbi:hypothetical protein JCM11641_005860 [Rhodosporidiobolus odoratus]
MKEALTVRLNSLTQAGVAVDCRCDSRLSPPGVLLSSVTRLEYTEQVTDHVCGYTQAVGQQQLYSENSQAGWGKGISSSSLRQTICFRLTLFLRQLTERLRTSLKRKSPRFFERPSLNFASLTLRRTAFFSRPPFPVDAGLKVDDKLPSVPDLKRLHRQQFQQQATQRRAERRAQYFRDGDDAEHTSGKGPGDSSGSVQRNAMDCDYDFSAEAELDLLARSAAERMRTDHRSKRPAGAPSGGGIFEPSAQYRNMAVVRPPTTAEDIELPQLRFDDCSSPASLSLYRRSDAPPAPPPLAARSDMPSAFGFDEWGEPPTLISPSEAQVLSRSLRETTSELLSLSHFKSIAPKSPHESLSDELCAEPSFSPSISPVPSLPPPHFASPSPYILGDSTTSSSRDHTPTSASASAIGTSVPPPASALIPLHLVPPTASLTLPASFSAASLLTSSAQPVRSLSLGAQATFTALPPVPPLPFDFEIQNVALTMPYSQQPASQPSQPLPHSSLNAHLPPLSQPSPCRPASPVPFASLPLSQLSQTSTASSSLSTSSSSAPPSSAALAQRLGLASQSATKSRAPLPELAEWVGSSQATTVSTTSSVSGERGLDAGERRDGGSSSPEVWRKKVEVRRSGQGQGEGEGEGEGVEEGEAAKEVERSERGEPNRPLDQGGRVKAEEEEEEEQQDPPAPSSPLTVPTTDYASSPPPPSQICQLEGQHHPEEPEGEDSQFSQQSLGPVSESQLDAAF